jgi:glycosyltransferase involved in cell wall biosynthesis
MRLLVASPWAERIGGAENILYSFLRRVDRERIEPLAVFLAAGGFEADVAALGVQTAIVPTTRLRRGGSAPSAIRRLHGIIRSERPDVVLSWGPKPHVYLGPACMLAGIRRRCVWRATELPQAAVHRLALALPAATIVCASHFVARAHRSAWPRRHVVVSEPGLVEPPRAPADEIAALRDRLAIPASAAVVGAVGRLVPVKKLDRVLRITAALRAEGIDAHALLVGGDVHGFAPEYEPYLRELAADLRLDGAVTFTGHVEDIAPYVAMMDAFVTAAPDEGFGAAVVEALALGVPVVAVDEGGPTEIVEDNQSGLIVPDDSPDGLVVAVRKLLTEPGLRARLGRGARTRFENRFTAEKGVERLTHVLEGVADRAR